jgi:hypothetical protein
MEILRNIVRSPSKKEVLYGSCAAHWVENEARHDCRAISKFNTIETTRITYLSEILVCAA